MLRRLVTLKIPICINVNVSLGMDTILLPKRCCLFRMWHLFSQRTSRFLNLSTLLTPLPVLHSIPCNEGALSVTKDEVLNRIHRYPKGTSCGKNGLIAHYLVNMLSGAASAILDGVM